MILYLYPILFPFFTSCLCKNFIIMSTVNDVSDSLTRNSGQGRECLLTQGPSDSQKATGVSTRLIFFDVGEIRGLKSDFNTVEHHLAPSSSDLRFLSEPQLSANFSSDLFKISNNNIFPLFRKMGGIYGIGLCGKG